MRLGHANDQRPVDLARRTRAEGFRQRRGGKTGLRHQQAAGGVLVEAVDEARALRVRVLTTQCAQHAVEVMHRAGAALHGKAHRLVEHQHVVVFVERDRLDEGAVLLRLRRVVARLGGFELERRDAHRLPRLEAILRLRALAVHPHLALADDALDMAERQAGKARFEEAIDAHAGFVGGDTDILHGSRKQRRLRRSHWWRRGLQGDRRLTRRARGKGPAPAAITIRRVLCA